MNDSTAGFIAQMIVLAFIVLWAVGVVDWAYDEIVRVVKAWWRNHQHGEAIEMDAEMEHAWYAAHAVERLRRRLAVSDQIADLPEHEQQRLQRLAEPLGFLDEDDPCRGCAGVGYLSGIPHRDGVRKVVCRLCCGTGREKPRLSA